MPMRTHTIRFWAWTPSWRFLSSSAHCIANDSFGIIYSTSAHKIRDIDNTIFRHRQIIVFWHDIMYHVAMSSVPYHHVSCSITSGNLERADKNAFSPKPSPSSTQGASWWRPRQVIYTWWPVVTYVRHNLQPFPAHLLNVIAYDVRSPISLLEEIQPSFGHVRIFGW